jgi:hypothetical protein
MVKNKYARIKYKAIKKKSPYLLEFRLFEGDSNIERLINNVLITIILLHKTADDEKKQAIKSKVNNENNVNNVNNENYYYYVNKDYNENSNSSNKLNRFRNKYNTNSPLYFSNGGTQKNKHNITKYKTLRRQSKKNK